MPSFDITSELDNVALRHALDAVSRTITGRYDFKDTSAKVDYLEKENIIVLFGDSDFQLEQIKAILLPAMEKKEVDSSKRLDYQNIEKISGNKVKQQIKIKTGLETEFAKKLSKTLKDSGLKVQASIQGDSVRVNGAKRDTLQEAIALLKKTITEYPLQFGNFRE